MDNINGVFKYILEGVKNHKLDMETGSKIINLLQNTNNSNKRDIAVIGMSAKFPFADSFNEFWNVVLKNSISCVREFPLNRARQIEPIFSRLGLENIEFAKGSYLEDIGSFDYRFFQISYREAKLMDPNQRLFLQSAWEAIENAGYGGNKIKGTKTGIYLGYSSDFTIDYKRAIEIVTPDLEEMSLAGNIKSIIASRLSYLLDLKGPSILIDTACSSSLVAVHKACKAIRDEECDMALSGSVKIILAPFTSKGEGVRIVSPDGKAKAFDDSANGTGLGEGVAVVLLKRLDKALKDGDSIHAIIKGSAINQDGSSIGITAPNPIAQEEVICDAWKDADIDPQTISYIEAHGTGTPLGDPVEIDGISSAFRRFSQKKQFCAVGSIKTNIGHLDHAAGIASLLKVIMALKNKKIPPNLNLKTPNRKISFEESPVFINDTLMQWDVGSIPRRAGISSFGLSGTNCHLVVEEASLDTHVNESSNQKYLFSLSAQNKKALERLINIYIAFTKKNVNIDPGNLSFTANTGRGHFSHRIIIIFSSVKDLLIKLVQANIDKKGSYAGEEIFYNEHKLIKLGRYEEDAIGLTEKAKRILNEKALKLTNQMGSFGQKSQLNNLQEICRLYIEGAEIDWEQFYIDRSYKRISLPVYSFDKKNVWLDIDSHSKNSYNDKSMIMNKYFKLNWVKEKLNIVTKENTEGCFLVLNFKESDFSKSFTRFLKENNIDFIEVNLHKDLSQSSNINEIVKNMNKEYESLFGTLKNMNISQVFFLYIDGLDFGTEASIEIINFGIYSLFYFVRNLVIDKEINKRNIKIVLLSDKVYKVSGDSHGNAKKAAFFGLGKVIGQEYLNIQCKCIDVDLFSSINKIFEEAIYENETFQVAYRNGQRYIQNFDIVHLDNLENSNIEIKEEGVYVITGGKGGIGLELGKYLASKNRISLVLLNRSKLPPRSDWNNIINQKVNEKLYKKIIAINDMENYGAKVYNYCADVTDESDLERVLSDVRKNVGEIKGIIHCAGIAGEGLIYKKEFKRFKDVLGSKVMGTVLLDKLTQFDNLDFYILFSSINAVMGGPGQGDYCAANSFMDSYAEYRDSKGKRTLCINWPAWKETGMAVDYGVNKDNDYFRAINTKDALLGFEEVLQKQISNIMICEINCYDFDKGKHGLFRISEQVQRLIAKENNLNKVNTQDIELEEKKAVEPKVIGRKNESYNNIETTLAKAWAEVLEMEEVNIYDSFHELGGDSISAGVLIQKINKDYPDCISVVDIYSYPTIIQMSEYISSQLKQKQENRKEQIEELPNDEEDNFKELFRDLKSGNISLEETLELMSKEWNDE